MIYDTIENLAQYAPLLPGLEKAAAFLAGEVIGRLAERQDIITTQDLRVAVGRKLHEKGYPLTAKRYLEHVKK